MRISYVYHLDAGQPSVQSGRPTSILNGLISAGVEVLKLFPLEHRFQTARWANKLFWHSLGQHYLLDRHPALLRDFARQVEVGLKKEAGDVIFSPSTLPINNLRSELPITFCADACFGAMLNYYGAYSRLSSAQTRHAEKAEAGVLERAALAVYPSQWAADAAMQHYGISADRIAVIPFGANFGNDNQEIDVARWIEARDNQVVRLLFVGREWERKGGDIVVETALTLAAHGFRVRLDIVGTDVPAQYRKHSFIVSHGLLSYSKPEQLVQLRRLFEGATFLFVPSRAEAFGMVYCEANAFGLPCIAAATGGITGIIRDGINGYGLPIDAGPKEYAVAIAAAVEDSDRYRALALTSFREFKERLNWDVFCERYLSLVNERVLGGGVAPSMFHERGQESGVGQPRIAYVSILPADDINAWSGLNHNIASCLRAQGANVESIGPLASPRRVLWTKLRTVVRSALNRKRYLWTRDLSLLHYYAQETARRLEGIDYDLLFSPGTEPISFLPATIKTPIAFWTDAPFGAMLDYYPWYTGLGTRCVKEGLASDTEALRRAALGVYSSDWALRYAINRHSGSADRLAVIPFGSNLQSCVAEAEIDALVEQRLRAPWRFLFVGVDWERKGADVVLATVAELNRLGFPSEMSVVGCQPPARAYPLPSFVKLEGFIDKRSEAGKKRMAALYRSSLLFFMPSNAEAFGVVYCEANAHAVPCLATATGGIPTIIKEGINGRLLPIGAPIDDYVRQIRLSTQPEIYRRMAHDSLRIYRESLNWQVGGERLMEMIQAVVRQHPGSRRAIRRPETLPTT